MILALSVDALGDAALGDVIAACQARGIAAVCLVVKDVRALEHASAELRRGDVVLSAFRFTKVDDVEPEAAGHVAAMLGSPMLYDPNAPRAWVDAFVAAGGSVVTPVELDPQIHNVADQLSIATTSGLPSHIILRGGGPEAVQFEGRGIGLLMTQLSVAGYRGFLIIAPSSRATRQLWKTWLFNRQNWGCGSKTSDFSLVEIQ